MGHRRHLPVVDGHAGLPQSGRVLVALVAQRGMGDLLGLRQAGENREGIVSDEVDLGLFELARKLCERSPGLLDAYSGRRRLS